MATTHSNLNNLTRAFPIEVDQSRWIKEVKRALGREFVRTGLFPPWRYFCVRE